MGGLAGRLAVGPLDEARGLGTMFAAIAGGMSLGAVLFALAALRGDAVDVEAVPTPARTS